MFASAEKFFLIRTQEVIHQGAVFIICISVGISKLYVGIDLGEHNRGTGAKPSMFYYNNYTGPCKFVIDAAQYTF